METDYPCIQPIGDVALRGWVSLKCSESERLADILLSVVFSQYFLLLYTQYMYTNEKNHLAAQQK